MTTFFAFHWPLFLPRTIALISIAADRRKFCQCCKVSYSLQSTRKPQTMLVYTSLHLHIYFQMIVFVFSMFAERDEKTSQACFDENHAWCEDVVSTWPAYDSHLPTFFSNQTKRTMFIVFRYESETILQKTAVIGF